MMFPSRLLRLARNKRSLNILPLTTIPLQSQLTKMRAPSSTSHNPNPQNATVLSQSPKTPEMHHQADEETQIHKEKKISEGVQHQYFSGPEYRVIVEENPPRISHHTPDGTEHVIPDSHIVLYRIEKASPSPSPSDSPGGKQKGNIHALWLYVHPGEVDIMYTLLRRLSIL